MKPDTLTTPGEELRAAYTMALQRIIANVKDDPDRVEALKGVIAEVAKRAPDPEADFVRPQRRKR